jgi:hypothetical protein
MSLTGILAILVGWLMITAMHRNEPAKSPAPAKSRRWVRYILAFIGTWVLTAGMATVVQARF